jgi:thiosulfate/3-mercaptopyruvate sulfurtransferase
MPSKEAVHSLLESIGLHDDTQLIVYDVGGMASGRLWWMARWIGHDAVAVLDGGIAAWQGQGLPLTTKEAK